jgi:hypothetical protein
MIDYDGLKLILDAIADNAITGIGSSPHGAFWNSMSRNQFTTGEVPNIVRGGVTYHIPIVNAKKPDDSAILRVLLGPFPVQQDGSSTTIPQMPKGGPFITDSGYHVSIGGVDRTGAQIQADISEWLNNGMP